MKTNNRDFVCSWFNTLILTVIIGFPAVVAANAENNLDFDMLNGLFTPTQSARFFQAGTEQLEREIEIFNHPELYLRDDMLQIDPELIEQMNRDRPFQDLYRDDARYQLNRDR